MSAMARVLVRGAGVAGLVTALVLAEQGFAIAIVEQGGRVGAGASWQAGGMLAPWCEAETAPGQILDHAEPAIGWWLSHAPSVVRRGSLVLALSRDGGELTRFARRTTSHEWVDAQGIAALEPDLAGRFGRGLFFAREAHLDPRAALVSLTEQLHVLGAQIRFGTAEEPEGFDRVVDCRGLGARPVQAVLRGVRGEMLMLRCPELRLSRPVRLLHPRTPLYIVPRADHVFMVGATMIESERQGGITARAAMELLGAAYALHPALADAEIIETGAGLRPSFPDNMPRVQEAGRVISVNGMHRHGFLLAPVLAAEVASRLAVAGLQRPGALHSSAVG